MEIKTTKEIAEFHNKYNTHETELFQKWVALDDHLKVIEEIRAFVANHQARIGTSHQLLAIYEICNKQLSDPEWNSTQEEQGKQDNPFVDVDQEALSKYEEKKKEYGESWKTMPLEQLFSRLDGEIEELHSAHTAEFAHKEAIDVLNIARMIAERTKPDDN